MIIRAVNVWQHLYNERLCGQRERESEPKWDASAAIYSAAPIRRIHDDSATTDVSNAARSDEQPNDVAAVQDERLSDAVPAAEVGEYGISSEEAKPVFRLLPHAAAGNARAADGPAGAVHAGESDDGHGAATDVSVQSHGAAAQYENAVSPDADQHSAAHDPRLHSAS